MKGIVDRFEGEFVVIEIDGVTKDINKTDVDDKVKAGDSVNYIDGKWFTNTGETKSRSKEISDLMSDVWED